MLASSSRIATRRLKAPRARFNSTQTVSSSSTSNASNYALAGAAGGSIVLLGGYTYYHFSGLKTLVSTSQSIHSSAASAKNTLIEKTPSPNEALKYFHDVAKSYGTLIPGASSYIDSTFDSIDELNETHGEEVNKIVQGATDELKKIVKDGKADMETVFKVAEVLRRRGEELTKLAAQVSQDVVGPLLDQHPELKEKLGSGWSELKDIAGSSGEAKKVFDEASQQVQEIFKSGFSAESIDKARKLVQEKTEQVKGLSDKASGEAWDKAVKAAQPYLDKVPDIKDLITSNASTLSTSSASATAIWAALKSSVGDSKSIPKDKVEELKKLVQSKIEEAKEKGSSGGASGAWEALQKYAESAVPGGKEALSQIPDLQSLLTIAQSNSEDAQKLAKSTYEDILKVLREKAQEAKKLGEGAKEDVKESSSEGKEKKGSSSEGKENKKEKK